MSLSSEEWKEFSTIEPCCFLLMQKKTHNWLDVDIRLDHCQSYLKYGHPLWIYFRNSHDDSEDYWIPLVVDSKPFIPFPGLKPKISQYHFRQVCDFVSYHSDFIKELADQSIDFNGFVRSIEELRVIIESQKMNIKHDVENLSITSSIIDIFRIAQDPTFYVVFIRRDERGLPPHIHIGDHISYPLCTQFHCIVKLTSPEYIFLKGECEDTLEEPQLRGFIRSLRSSDEDGESNWRYALKSWNKSNHKVKIAIENSMPDYMDLLKFADWDSRDKKIP